MHTFSGDVKDNWEAFILQFERIAQKTRWSEKKKLRNLFKCLTGNESLYANKIKGVFG
jgi:hypothetical protein